MKTLQNHRIFFDAECPMCNVYTSAFVKTGMLEKSGRAAYQHTSEASCPQINRQRAVNEIALVNLVTGEVTYGVHSLFEILSHAFPVLRSLFGFAPFVWLMEKLYAFISYNRRVIIPAGKNTCSYPFQPSFNMRYRVAYLLFTWLVTAFILSAYTPLMGSLLPANQAYREYLVCGGQLLFQGTVISLVSKDQKWTYLGNMMSISMAGSLLLAPMLIIGPLLNLSTLLYAAYFLFVAALMLLEHLRRMRLLGLGFTLSVSWVIYRLGVLLLVLYSG